MVSSMEEDLPLRYVFYVIGVIAVIFVLAAGAIYFFV